MEAIYVNSWLNVISSGNKPAVEIKVTAAIRLPKNQRRVLKKQGTGCFTNPDCPLRSPSSVMAILLPLFHEGGLLNGKKG